MRGAAEGAWKRSWEKLASGQIWGNYLFLLPQVLPLQARPVPGPRPPKPNFNKLHCDQLGDTSGRLREDQGSQLARPQIQGGGQGAPHPSGEKQAESSCPCPHQKL